MPKPWTLLDTVETDEGLLELRRRGDRDFLVSIGKRVLMSSTFTRSEQALARLGCEAAREREAPRVLVGGLGLGYTLRAALDALPPSARVIVAELNPIVVRWCRGLAAPASGHALEDPRVEVIAGDVTDRIREAAAGAAFDAILLDLYVGPGRTTDADPLYGPRGYRARARRAHAGRHLRGVGRGAGPRVRAAPARRRPLRALRARPRRRPDPRGLPRA
ncbi:MAG: hypothetical protein M5U28_15970 [Sandaracinaceae bacterium]|nr:hypothetical protein [Sandaracinaceae bacterium]